VAPVGSGARALDPSKDPSYLKGRDLHARGRLAEAEAELRAALGRFPHAPPIERELARVLMGSRRYEEALALLDDAVQGDPSHTATLAALVDLLSRTTEVVSPVYVGEGNELRPAAPSERRRTADASVLLEKLNRDAPRPDLAIRLAIVEARLGHDERAIELLSSVSPVSTLGGLALYDLGLVHLRAGDAAKAARALIEAARLEPERAEPSFALGLARQELGDMGAALVAFSEAERRSPAFAPACFLHRGQIKEASGSLEEAASDYRRASQGAEPAIASRAETGLGHVLLRLGRSGDASAAFEAAASHGGGAEARFNLGVALALSGNASAARKQVEVLRTLDVALASRLDSFASSLDKGSAKSAREGERR
jgi:tetratricopeptide (TPR) repeat protein